MYKFVALALCLAVASAAIAPVTDFTQFFQGLNDQLGVTSDSSFDACEEVPLISDIQKTFKDLNSSNTLGLVADVLALYSDYNKIKTSCPALLSTYEAFFSTFVADIKANPKTVGLQVLENAVSNFQSLYADVAQAITDADAQNFYDLGQDVAKAVASVLGTYIN